MTRLQKIHNKILMIATVLIAVFYVLSPTNLLAAVTGPCYKCHTMHYSENGMSGSMADGEFGDNGGPYSALVVNSCVGCHTGTNDINSTTPYVLSENVLNESDFSKTKSDGTVVGKTLAGGNFWWVATAGGGDDTKGHNVMDVSERDSKLKSAPGATSGTCIACHESLIDTGCQGCHLAPKHHANDGSGTKLVNSKEQGWYRFLSGHETGAGKGVEGIEHEKWNFEATEASHNEYLGKENASDNYGFALGNTTTAFCTGCHGIFHSQQSGGAWIRHPSDFTIPDSGEYVNAFGGVYDPNVPVARPALPVTNPSAVTPGTDMVMCLSCHVAHGSPYPDMLRWDYDGMIAGDNGESGGCFKCHTEKND